MGESRVDGGWLGFWSSWEEFMVLTAGAVVLSPPADPHSPELWTTSDRPWMAAPLCGRGGRGLDTKRSWARLFLGEDRTEQKAKPIPNTPCHLIFTDIWGG